MVALLEDESALALVEQVDLTSNRAPNSLRSPHLVEASQDESRSQECIEITTSLLEGLQNTARPGTPAQRFEEGDQQEFRVVAEPVRREPQEEAVGVEVGGTEMQEQGDLEEGQADDADGHENKQASEAPPATQLQIDKHRFRLRGIRRRQLAGTHTNAKTVQYRLVWGEHPNRSDAWVNEDDVQLTMIEPPCERFCQDLVSSVERGSVRVHRMHCVLREGGKRFEYLVDELSTWITEDQLRISSSPTLESELKGKWLIGESPSLEELGEGVANGRCLKAVSSPPSLRQAQAQIHIEHPANTINEEHSHTSRASQSRSPSSSYDMASGGERSENGFLLDNFYW